MEIIRIGGRYCLRLVHAGETFERWFVDAASLRPAVRAMHRQGGRFRSITGRVAGRREMGQQTWRIVQVTP